jgi:hypothetical protein
LLHSEGTEGRGERVEELEPENRSQREREAERERLEKERVTYGLFSPNYIRTLGTDFTYGLTDDFECD